MAYDYSSDNKRLEIPNPYKAQNRLLLFCAAVLLLAGVVSLWSGRSALASAHAWASLPPIAVGLGLLAAGLIAAATAARRLRFFFGRGRPAPLAPELNAGTVGGSRQADQYKEVLRQSALVYREPVGAVEGLLYHWMPRLITAPDALQTQARLQFFNLAALLVTTLSFAVAWLAFGNELSRPWLSWGYFLFGAFFLLKPILGEGSARISLGALVGLIAAALLAPVLIGLAAPRLPNLQAWSLGTQTSLMLGAGLIGLCLTVAALLGQVQAPPQTQTSAVQERLSINVPPALLLDELERHLQDTWTERIPNRRYAKLEPAIEPTRQAGPFAGELFEESQPMPLAGAASPGIGAALRSTRHRWTVVLDLYATLLTLAAVVSALRFVASFNVDLHWHDQPLAQAGLAAILMLVAAFCWKSAAWLWGRFDFESTLVWVELVGTYQTATMGTGNVLHGQLNTQNVVVRTEAMTLRIWRARIESVCFGKDAARQITTLQSTDKEARELARHLRDFGQSRASMVSPNSASDQATVQGLAEVSAKLVHADEHAQRQLGDTGPRHCSACGAAVPAGARFCPSCGAALAV
jgi:hypothetical protein